MIDFGIIAAGTGSRIKAEGSNLPKPLQEIEGVPMIGRLVKMMENCGAGSVSVVINSDMPEVEGYLNTLVPEMNCTLRFVSTKTPSSFHTFCELIKIMNPEDKFVVTTVDTIFDSKAFQGYVECFTNVPERIDGLMGVTSYIDDESPLYVKTTAHDRIISGFTDIPDTGTKYVSAGVYGLRSSALPVLRECVASGISRMRNFQRKLVEAGLRLEAYDMGMVVDIDHLSDIQKANRFLAERKM